eukprot:Colp12_sorted_trinity150504_noHs@10717
MTGRACTSAYLRTSRQQGRFHGTIMSSYNEVLTPFDCRYHSLAGDPSTTPADLIVTSTTNNIIMGVRHKTYAMEVSVFFKNVFRISIVTVQQQGVQYHPESIKSEHGMTMIKNFLSWTSGLWSGMKPSVYSPEN